MIALHVTNVNNGLATALAYLLGCGDEEPSRNGPVLVAPEPVCTVYEKPYERVLFSPKRDANPFFHFMEALWMLGGRHDIKWPAYFNKQMIAYSDDGETQHGAYGRRWRSWFGYDQLPIIINELKKNPASRRCVLSMWDACGNFSEYEDEHNCWTSKDGRAARAPDLQIAMNGGKDVPCNTHIYFRVIKGALDMTVCCRSNDVFWGTFGANAVHFSFLHEYMATATGVSIGTYRQMSNNFHAYTDIFPAKDWEAIAIDADTQDAYKAGDVYNVPIINTNVELWNTDLARFLQFPSSEWEYNDQFFTGTAYPMYRAWYARKQKYDSGMAWAERIAAPDWRKACTEWIARRENR